MSVDSIDSLQSGGWIIPDWPAPVSVKALCSTRIVESGRSKPPFNQFNVAAHVGDSLADVKANRELLPCPDITWLEQIHSVRAIELPDISNNVRADACFTSSQDTTCGVLTADCLPVLLCDTSGHWVAAIHAGWRGLAGGIIENTLQSISQAYKINQLAEKVMVWLGPAIGPSAFEVGEDVLEAFSEYAQAFVPADDKGKYMCDLYQIAQMKLQGMGIGTIYGGDLCTYSDPQRFYSYRREGVTGRMLSCIWIDGNNRTNE